MSTISTDARMRKAAQILTRKGVVSFAELEKIFLTHRDAGGCAFVLALVELGKLSPEEAAQIISESFGFPYTELTAPIDKAVVETLPFAIAQKCMAIPVRKQGNTMTVAMEDPSNLPLVEAVRKALGMNVDVQVASSAHIVRILDRFARESRAEADGTAAVGDTEAPAIQFVDDLLQDAVKKRATDIHIEPCDGSVTLRYRIDGILYEEEPPTSELFLAIVSRIKILGQMDIGERRLPQAGRLQTRVDGTDYDFRLSTFPTLYGENVVIRVLAAGQMLLDLKGLGFPDVEHVAFDELIHRPNGIILVTGPTGSGKSTTLYAGLNTIKSSKINIHTLEDPVEARISGIRQTQINTKADLTFSASLRDMLRQDPDVIMIGEIRDVETATIAIHASLTGHLVLSTLHTNSAAGAISRLDNMEIEPFLVASSVIGIVAQRLVRTLCSHCREVDETAKERLLEMEPTCTIESGGAVYREVGCDQCHGTGFSGRTGVFELLVPDEEIQRLTIQQRPAQEIELAAVAKGMTTLWKAGLKTVAEGKTTLAEMMRVVH